VTRQDHIPTEQQSYPRWCCERCGLASGGDAPSERAEWRMDTCEICGSKKWVTNPRDFGYPDFRTLSAEKLHGPQGHRG
jgi:hypothetical protein